jgi:hypothetical protein
VEVSFLSSVHLLLAVLQDKIVAATESKRFVHNSHRFLLLLCLLKELLLGLFSSSKASVFEILLQSGELATRFRLHHIVLSPQAPKATQVSLISSASL